MLFREEETAALEALLFVAKEPLSIEKLAGLLDISTDNVKELIDVLEERYKKSASGLLIIEVDQGFRLGTKPEVSHYIETLYKQPTQALSNAALEVLSIIAYKQPITRGEIDFIRGVQSDRALTTLVEKGLVANIGRKESPGRPRLFGTTEEFLLHFGLKSLDDLPEIEFGQLEEEEEENILEENGVLEKNDVLNQEEYDAQEQDES